MNTEQNIKMEMEHRYDMEKHIRMDMHIYVVAHVCTLQATEKNNLTINIISIQMQLQNGYAFFYEAAMFTAG